MKFDIITVKEGNRCPNCNAKIPCQTSAIGAHIPVPGDVSICINCQCILVFDETLSTRNPTAAEIEEFKSDTDLWKLIHKCRYYIKEIK
jgi:hypothetical protein